MYCGWVYSRVSFSTRGFSVPPGVSLLTIGIFSRQCRCWLLAGLCRSGSRTANRDNDVSRKPGQQTSPSAAGFHCPVLVTTHDSPPTPHHMTNSRDICRFGKRNCIETTHNYMSPN